MPSRLTIERRPDLTRSIRILSSWPIKAPAEVYLACSGFTQAKEIANPDPGTCLVLPAATYAISPVAACTITLDQLVASLGRTACLKDG